MEIYKLIIDYPNYEVSNLGNIKNKTTGLLLNQSLNKDGYKTVGLSKDGKKGTIRVHRLIAIAFIENPNNKPIVDHINRIRDDNRLVNLRWATCSENQMNKTCNKKNPDKVRGVSLQTYGEDIGLWRARIKKDNCNYELGCYESFDEALAVRIKKEIELFGEFNVSR